MRLKRRFEHMIKSIDAEPGLIDDCTHMVYLNDGYTHEGFGDSYPVKNSKELEGYMEEVIPTDENTIDVACLTQPIDFYNISKLGDVTLTYYVESIVRTLNTTGENLLNIFFNDSTIDEYNMINLNDILKIAGSEKTYIIHGYDISWWRNNLKRLDNGLRKLEKKEEVRKVEIKLIETDTHEILAQDISNWFEYDESNKLEEQVKYNIAVAVEEYLNGHYDESAYAIKETKAELLDRVYEQITTTFNSGGHTHSSNQLRYFGKDNTIALIKLYINNYADLQDFIQRGEK